MLKLVKDSLSQRFVELAVPIQPQADAGIEQPDKGGGIEPVTAAQVAVLVNSLDKHLLDRSKLPGIDFLCHFAIVALAW